MADEFNVSNVSIEDAELILDKPLITHADMLLQFHQRSKAKVLHNIGIYKG